MPLHCYSVRSLTHLSHLQVLLALYYVATGLGYFVSVVSPKEMSQLVGVVFVFCSGVCVCVSLSLSARLHLVMPPFPHAPRRHTAMFGGGMPTLKVLEGKMPPIRWMPYISFIRYALEAMYVGEIVEYKKIIQLQVRRACVCVLC